jgi:hypothetical protein
MHGCETGKTRDSRFCPLIMRAGRPQRADPGSLYAIAHQFYWDFRRLAEGSRRWRDDPKLYQELTANLEDLPLVGDGDRARHEQLADEEIRMGRLDASQREERIQYIADSELWVRRDSYLRDAGEAARREIKIPGEPAVIKVLLDPKTTPEQVRALCRSAHMLRSFEVEPGVIKKVEVPAWPIPAGSPFPGYLSQYAEQYVEALRDPRFPRCDVSTRPSSQLKQFWFLSRALAGALFGVSTRTAINLVGSLRPEQAFEESRGAKPARKQRRLRTKL